MATLAKLPDELLEHIGHFLPLDAFGALRLTCRATDQKLGHSFERRFFLGKTVHLQQDSLQTLVDLSKSGYAKRIRTLKIGFGEEIFISTLGQNGELQAGMSVSVKAHPIIDPFLKDIGIAAGDEIVLSQDEIDAYEDFLRERKEFWAKDLPYRLLAEALPGFTSIESITLDDKYWGFRPYLDSKLLYLFFLELPLQAARTPLSFQHSDAHCNDVSGFCAHNHPFTILCRALRTSNTSLVLLKLSCLIYGDHLFSAAQQESLQLETTFKDLEMLALQTRFSLSPNPPSFRNHTFSLAWAKDLQSLSFENMSGSSRYAMVEALTYDDALNKLKVLTFQDMEIEHEVLRLLLLHKAPSLERILLGNITLVEDAWPEVFEAMADFPALDNLFVRSLRTGETDPSDTIALNLFETAEAVSHCFSYVEEDPSTDDESVRKKWEIQRREFELFSILKRYSKDRGFAFFDTSAKKRLGRT
ncbi:hypothetical protein BDV96DRAFT_15161 [Lophiotrema nucula]|uniref:F-box domain-containing protein n=1 Tax=Lophiotrema nucula TaxID=690887 RepID=A0A6A5ZTY1_9PLEO|nr:hypothetical protein BDV96DRAFT_15161 [Lophiotrema nucula]